MKETLANLSDVVMISLDIDSSENPSQLKTYAQRNGFVWRFAVAPRDMLVSLQEAYGAQFLSPTAEPMFFVSPGQRPSASSFGRRDSATIRGLVARNRTP